MMEVFRICGQYGNHEPQATTEHLNCGWCHWGIEIEILFYFNEFE